MFFGYHGWAQTGFSSQLPFDTTVDAVFLSNGIYDEIKIDDDLDISENIIKQDWGVSTQLLADF